jgi:hypothetical protein
MDSSNSTAIDTVRAEVQALAIIKDYAVASPLEAVTANEALGKVKLLGKALDAAKAGELAPLNEEVKKIRERYRGAEELLVDAEATLKRALVGFRLAEDKRLQDERRAQIELATQERARLEQQARREREAAAARAAKLELQGKAEQAEAVVQAAETRAQAAEQTAQLVAAPPPAAAPTKLDGASMREVWRAKIIDSRQFLVALSNSPYDPETVVAFKQAGLDALAKSMKSRMETVLPGSIAWSETSMAARAR